MVHVHARDPKDLTLCAGEPEPWKEVISKIRKACPDILVNATTGGGPNMTMEQRLSSLEGNPDLASLDLAPDMSMFHLKERQSPAALSAARNGHRRVRPHTYGQIRQFAAEMKKRPLSPSSKSTTPAAHG